MKNLPFFFLILLLVGGCSRPNNFEFMDTFNVKKQKMKINNLEKKLERAEEVEYYAKQEVINLRREIDEAKIALIRKQIDGYERVKTASNVFFVEEREALYELIQEGPSSTSLDAQVELDRILRIITEQGDEEKRYVF